jgi:hypothetical protein
MSGTGKDANKDAHKDANRDELDELLERLPPPEAPAELSQRVLAGLAKARAPRRPVMSLALAAAGVATLASVLFWRNGASPTVELARGADLEADDELLIYAVENWELLHDDDLDVWLASLDPLDELLVEIAEGEEWPEDAADEEGGR